MWGGVKKIQVQTGFQNLKQIKKIEITEFSGEPCEDDIRKSISIKIRII